MTNNATKTLAQDVVAAFRKEGYTLFAEELPEDVPIPETRDRRVQPSQLKFKAGRRPAGAPSIRHRPPTVPLILDGKSVKPQTITELDGQPLYFAVESDGEHKSKLYAFTQEEHATDHIIAGLEGTQEEHEDMHGFFGSHVQPSYPVYLFENAGCQGGRLSLDYRHAFWDLTQVWLGGILWWWTSWNDQISSLITTGRGVKLYEDVYWGGSWIYFGSSKVVWDLTAYGWNDRTSSVETTY